MHVQNRKSTTLKEILSPVFTGFDTIAEHLGAALRVSLESLGDLCLFFYTAIFGKWRLGLIIEQMHVLGVYSLALVIFISAFIGFIAPITVYTMTGGMFLNYLGTAVIRVVMTEMGPTFTGLILAGRIGTKVASELGSMRVTEQFDAMECLSLNPMSYIIAPRIIACFIMGPVLFVLGSMASIVSAQVLATTALGVPFHTYYSSMRLFFSFDMVILGLLKSFAFVGLIGLTGCYYGYKTSGGAFGVGKSTRATVTGASILILIANFFLTVLFT